MRSVNKLTRPQIQAMLTHIGGFSGKNKGRKKDLKMFYHPLTPKDVCKIHIIWSRTRQ